MKFQVRYRDHGDGQTYNVTSDQHNKLITPFEDPYEAAKVARAIVSHKNFENAYALEEKLRNISNVFVDFVDEGDEVIDNFFFAGWEYSGGLKEMFLLEEGGDVSKHFVSETDYRQKFYIGSDVKDRKNDVYVDYYLTYPPVPTHNAKVTVIDQFSDKNLLDKDFYFIVSV
jgi:hypothetical protein